MKRRQLLKADEEETAFNSPLGLLQFAVMHFGLSGTPATFQCTCMMDPRLRLGCRPGCSIADIL